ncbi:MAG: GTPase, partial [Acidimicrobiia bacterium]
HGDGTGDILDAVIAHFEQEPAPADLEAGETEATPNAFSIAIIGRPNVGKSSLFNQLVGEDRAVVHDMPGTTRDSIDTIVEGEWGQLRFVDTAGMRRVSRIDEGTEYYSLVRALQALDLADGALLVIDATEGVTAQDQRLAERLDASGNAAVIVLNKWDLLDTEAREKCREDVGRKLAFLGYAPVMSVCAASGKNVNRLIPALIEAREAYRRRIPTGELNRVLGEAQRRHAAPPDRGRRPKIMYGTQGAVDPPTFTLFSNGTIAPTYLRYIERCLREAFDIGPTPIKLRVRRRGDN